MMRALILMLTAFSISACSTAGPINRVSADARQELGRLSATYAAFAANNKEIADARIEADAAYRVGLADREEIEAETALIERVSETPSVAFATDVNKVRALLKNTHLAPPTADAFRKTAGENLVKVAAPAESLAKVNATLRQLERKRSSLEALLDYAAFFAETFALIEEGLDEARKQASAAASTAD